MEFARRGRSDGDIDDGHRFLHFNAVLTIKDSTMFVPRAVDPMLVIRNALLSQLQKDRLRQDIFLAELAKIERAMVLRNDSRQENAKLEERKLQESSETIQPKKTLPSVKWEMTEITIPVKKPHWELTCDICQVQATSEHSLQEHCAGQKYRSNVATVELRNKLNLREGGGTDNIVFLISCEVGNVQCNSEGTLADCCNKEHMEKHEVLNVCEVCNLQCNSGKMIAHHRSGNRHQKRLDALKRNAVAAYVCQ
ncbi:hypothetical protein C2845_PM04G12830 [Panicum miliaceum]|uniref:C2H2-type domain-containing protein n=1 Tax=Panicum miliaceum TaxID=4540 RepID=A0A3L6QV83_PANMI|nr:hypothetical protein C2845_PM04G12830 [Panicum miliaceum]